MYIGLPPGVPALQGALKHLHKVEMRCYCPQTFLSVHFQRGVDISESN